MNITRQIAKIRGRPAELFFFLFFSFPSIRFHSFFPFLTNSVPRDYGKLSALLEISEELADKIHGMGLGHDEERAILSVYDLQLVVRDLLGEERSDKALSNLLEAIASVGPFTVADVKTAWREFENQGLRPPGVDDVIYFGYFLFQRAEKSPPPRLLLRRIHDLAGQ